jgi:bifunctional non-homologous end joining protein LigD
MPARVKAKFIDPMLLLRTDKLPEGERWLYELKLDGCRAIAFKSGRELHLRSRNDNDFSVRYAPVMKGLAKLPAETVVDGEVVVVDENGRRRLPAAPEPRVE